MRISVLVTKTTYGKVEIDVPEGSVILDPEATTLKKRREARRLAETMVEEDECCIIWDLSETQLNVDNGYWELEEM